jgi:hypothetical protein
MTSRDTRGETAIRPEYELTEESAENRGPSAEAGCGCNAGAAETLARGYARRADAVGLASLPAPTLAGGSTPPGAAPREIANALGHLRVCQKERRKVRKRAAEAQAAWNRLVCPQCHSLHVRPHGTPRVYVPTQLEAEEERAFSQRVTLAKLTLLIAQNLAREWRFRARRAHERWLNVRKFCLFEPPENGSHGSNPPASETAETPHKSRG